MGKKKFLEILKTSSQPLRAGAEKSFDDGDYDERQILKRTNQDSKVKLNGRSRPENATMCLLPDK